MYIFKKLDQRYDKKCKDIFNIWIWKESAAVNDTGNIFVQLMAQHCCIASSVELSLVVPVLITTACSTCHVIDFSVAS